MSKIIRNTIGHSKIMTAKNEVKPDEHRLIQRDRPDLINGIHLVACPWKNFDVATTKECSKCPFWTGFIAADRAKPLIKGNAWTVCSYPMGRQIQTIKV